jgi:hypothetical protein
MTSLTPISHDFNGQIISQLQEDTLINEVMVPKGFVNATEMCKANGKQWKRFSDTKQFDTYVEALIGQTGLTSDVLIYTITSRDNQYRGTWTHHLIGLELARWISPEFGVWANITLWAVINGDFKALTVEALEAQVKVQAIWQEVRLAGKVTRRTLTDAIKDWYIRNPNGSSRPQHVMYAQTTNKIYQVLWDKTALEIEALLRCERNKSRDFMSVECLQVLDRAEHRVMEYIDDDNIKPVDAVELSGLRKSRVPLI